MLTTKRVSAGASAGAPAALECMVFIFIAVLSMSYRSTCCSQITANLRTTHMMLSTCGYSNYVINYSVVMDPGMFVPAETKPNGDGALI